MSTENNETAPDPDEGAGINLEMTFVESVEALVKASPWLGGADLPAVKLLHTIAKQLDEATTAGDEIQTYRMAQFNNLQQRLVARDPDAKGKRAAAATPADESAQVLDMFLNNPGVWTAP